MTALRSSFIQLRDPLRHKRPQSWINALILLPRAPSFSHFLYVWISFVQNAVIFELVHGLVSLLKLTNGKFMSKILICVYHALCPCVTKSSASRFNQTMSLWCTDILCTRQTLEEKFECVNIMFPAPSDPPLYYNRSIQKINPTPQTQWASLYCCFTEFRFQRPTQYW